MLLLNLRLQEEMQISGIHIGITEYRILGQGAKGGGERGFTGPALTADNHYFAHAASFS